MKQYLVNRKTYKEVRKYNHDDFDKFCNTIYNKGYLAGKNEAKIECDTKNNNDFDVNKILLAIKEIRGIGELTYFRIKSVIENIVKKEG